MEELVPCELGNKDFWESTYDNEIKLFESQGDPGEIWFGEDVANRILRWFGKNVKEDFKILDLGCGNGMFLIELHEEGFHNLFGVDYSEKAIKLAQSVALKHEVNISFSVGNILTGLEDTFDVIHDKGTFDAISLSEGASDKRRDYIKSVIQSLSREGHFIITSCNWTLEELDVHFAEDFVRVDLIPAPQFKFGGVVGRKVTSCIYKKKIKQ